MSELQRVRSEDRRHGSRIAAAREDVEDDVGRMNAFADRLGASGFDRRQSIGEHGGENVDHLTIAVVGTGELAPHPRSKDLCAVGGAQSLNGAPLRNAPGLRANTGT